MYGGTAHDAVHDTAHGTAHDAVYDAAPGLGHMIVQESPVEYHTDKSITDKWEKLVSFCGRARSRKEMQQHLGIGNRAHFSKMYLKPLLESGRIRMTLPDKPQSRYQKYIAAEKTEGRTDS